MSLRKKILDRINERAEETVHVPEWGMDVLIRELSALEREQYLTEMMSGDEVDIRGASARLVVASVVGEDGLRMFQPEDANELNGAGSRAIERIVRAAKTLNGMESGESKDDDAKN